MKYVRVKTNLIDLMKRPDFLAERLNQAFYGEPLVVSSQRGGWLKVAKLDGYQGWVMESLTEPISRSAYSHLKSTTPGRVIRISAGVVGYDRNSSEPHLLYYGSPVWVKGKSGEFYRIERPSGGDLLIRTSAVERLSSLVRTKLTPQRLVSEARKFLGVPYLWGGISSAGWDCSGMVQTIFARFGIILPRDTKDQIKVGREIEASERRTGDLIFFKRHVGLAIGKHRLIHSSLSGGGVRINSLDRNDENYRADLEQIYLQTRRVV